MKRLRRLLAAALILGGGVTLSWVAFERASAAWYQRQSRAALDSVRIPSESQPRVAPASVPVGELIGTLEITRVGLSGVVVEGDSDGVLDRAIGHLPDTPLPWQDGNSALAAHRDTLFRPLEGVRLGDVLRLRTPHGDFDFIVREILIVKPHDVWVLDPTPVASLTLISCWPFKYIGNAPERFIVRAERVSTVSDTDKGRI